MRTVLRSPRFGNPSSAQDSPPREGRGVATKSQRGVDAALAEPLARLLVHAGDRLAVIRLAETSWLEGAGKFVRIHIAGQAYLYRRSLSGLELRLDPRQFVRIHRSRIVNLDAILEIEPLEGGAYDVLLRDGSRHVVSRRHRRRFLVQVSEG